VRADRLPYTTAIESPLLFSTSQLLSQLTEEPVQANKAIVGRNAFAHEAGIHQDGVLKDARTYEIMKPSDVGQSLSSRLVLGRHSGRHAVQSRCEMLGFTLTTAEVGEVYRAVISLGEHRKSIGDGDLRRIVDRVRTPASIASSSSTTHVETVGYGHGV
jgi:2-isopropylmalate synthase